MQGGLSMNTKKALKKLKKQQIKQRKTIKKLKNKLKAVSKLPTLTYSDSTSPRKKQSNNTTQQNITPMINAASKFHKQTEKYKLNKILMRPLKSRPCRKCPALSKGICKCAVKKYA